MRALRLRSNTILFGAILIGSAAATSSWAAEAAEAARGFAFASAHCAQCHGLDDKAPSPNPGAPSFPEIGRRRDPDGLSALLRQGPGHFAEVLGFFNRWLEEHEYESLAQLRGSLNLSTCPDPAAFERANYLKVLQSWDARPTSAKS